MSEVYKILEEEYSTWCGKKYGVAVNTGTAGLHLALLSLGVGPGDEVIVPDLAFASVAFAVSYCGATPVFVGCREDYNIDPFKIVITPKTKAIIGVHTYGNLCDMDRLLSFGVPVIEDACFSAGTKILTSSGQINIEDIKVGDMVMTRNGYKKVLVSALTGFKKTINKLGINATPDHPFITTTGEKRLDSLCGSDTLYIWNEKLSLIEEKTIIDIQNQNVGILGYIFAGIQKLVQSIFTGKFGLITMVKYLRDLLFIIVMKTLSIMKYLIFNVFQIQNILNYIVTNLRELNWLKKILYWLEKKLKYGTLLKKLGNLLEWVLKNYGKIKKLILFYVQNVEKNIKHIFQLKQNSVQENVKIEQELEPVYNLTIEDCHEFFANNILVHNCEAQGAPTGKGIMTVYSFYQNKIIPAEEGGIVLTDDKELHDKMQIMKNMGNVGGYYHPVIGYNYRMSNLQAELALQNFHKKDRLIEKRRKVEKLYIKAFGGIPSDTPWVYILRSKYRDEVVEKIPASRCFFKPMTSLPMYNQPTDSFTSKVSKEGLVISLDPKFDHELIIDQICDIFIR